MIRHVRLGYEQLVELCEHIEAWLAVVHPEGVTAADRGRAAGMSCEESENAPA